MDKITIYEMPITQYSFTGKKFHSHIVPINSVGCSICDYKAEYYYYDKNGYKKYLCATCYEKEKSA